MKINKPTAHSSALREAHYPANYREQVFMDYLSHVQDPSAIPAFQMLSASFIYDQVFKEIVHPKFKNIPNLFDLLVSNTEGEFDVYLCAFGRSFCQKRH